ncbi:MAG: DUF3883 domain-containing protein, partial [Lentimicrobiaceae bacterium]|nr:DUF3883 domain-containing protein [Lentimicrobiaceae bacterium]
MNILFARIGWMIHYTGNTSFDKITGGGAYPDEKKHEVFNFQNLNGFCYGYVQPPGNNIELCRINKQLKKTDNFIENVLVVWVSRRTAGSKIVGWYKNATVYRTYQTLDSKLSKYRNNYGYYIKAKYSDCKLLEHDERIFDVSGLFGRAQIRHIDSNNIGFCKKVITYIRNFDEKSLSSRKKTPLFNPIRTQIQIDAETKKKVEKSAIKVIWKRYERLGYTIKDVQNQNCGWDLEAQNKDTKLFLEVKGSNTSSPVIHISRNEYEKMKKYKKHYRLCVVTNALSNQYQSHIFIYDKNTDTWV